ncbi:hypothetical protein E4J89_17690 [Arthrobacter sp. CAU 1506]|uniref:ATP-binding protein n=1 Tax=Arthrobacter sp. CAU 1506 TaxID=2560052 RepID=UPI0010AC276C|nr:LuxR C-terminal-related transcriptional regulator [Arthrobacter sp. CAU 1506]TJY66114.1 hypothetical protein E4J89_17690 [Arthrobacter sp. CAU 1506]
MESTPFNGLPAELTPFVGRRAETENLRSLLSEQRYILIVGMSGVGKTRLSLHLAGMVQRAFHNNVYYVQAGTLTTQADLIAEIASVIGAPPTNSVEGIALKLKQRPALVIIDGADAPDLGLAQLASELLRLCHELKIVVTARGRTHLAGERVFTLGALPVPTPDFVEGQGVDRALALDSVELLVESIRQSVPAFEATRRNAEDLFTICRLTAGIPSYLEAAARAHGVLGARGLARTLSEQSLTLDEFTSPLLRKDVMRQAFEQGLKRVEAVDRSLYLKLALFHSPFDIQFAAEVFAEGDVGATAPSMARLVDQSLLTAQMVDGEPLFSMAAPYRHLALQQLRSTDGADAAGRLLREKLISHLHSAGEEWFSESQLPSVQFLNRYTAEVTELLDELSRTPRDAHLALNLICGLRYYWQIRPVVPWPRARDWINAALKSTHIPDTARLRALQMDAYIAFYENDLEEAGAQLRLAAALAADLHPEAKDLVFGIFIDGLLQFGRGELAAAERSFRQVANVAMAGQRMSDQVGERYWFLAMTLLAKGDLSGAEQQVQEGLRFCETHGDVWGRAYTMWLLALLLLRRGEEEKASRVLNQATEVLLAYQDRTGLTLAAQLMATIALGRGDHDFAARITSTLPDGGKRPPMLIGEIDMRRLEEIKAAVGSAPFKHQHLATHAFSVPEAISHVLLQKDLQEDSSQRPKLALDPAGQLSAREWEIGKLVAEGLGNPAIATRLVISRRTVEGHVQRILGKLGFKSRSQIAVWVSERRRTEPAAVQGPHLPKKIGGG